MDIRSFLLILNAFVIVFALTVFVVREMLNVVGETAEEQAEKENGMMGWFLASSIIGWLALPVMIGVKTWRWKRDKLSHFEWDKVVRNGMVIMLGGCVQMLLLMLTSCSSVRPSVATERIMYKTDTLYKTNVRADTFRVLDSVFVNQYVKGDTVYKEKTAYKWRDKVSVRVDTLYKTAIRTDSVRIPVPVERRLSAWEKTSMYLGKFITAGVVVMAITSLLLWLIHRKK